MQQILVFGPPTHLRRLLFVTVIFAYSLSVSFSAPVSSSSAAVFGGGVEISDSYARSIIFAPAEVKEEPLTTAAAIVETTEGITILETTSSVETNGTKETLSENKNVDSQSTEILIDQVAVSTIEKPQQTDNVKETTTEVNELNSTSKQILRNLNEFSAKDVELPTVSEQSIKETTISEKIENFQSTESSASKLVSEHPAEYTTHKLESSFETSTEEKIKTTTEKFSEGSLKSNDDVNIQEKTNKSDSLSIIPTSTENSTKELPILFSSESSTTKSDTFSETSSKTEATIENKSNSERLYEKSEQKETTLSSVSNIASSVTESIIESTTKIIETSPSTTMTPNVEKTLKKEEVSYPESTVSFNEKKNEKMQEILSSENNNLELPTTVKSVTESLNESFVNNLEINSTRATIVEKNKFSSEAPITAVSLELTSTDGKNIQDKVTDSTKVEIFNGSSTGIQTSSDVTPTESYTTITIADKTVDEKAHKLENFQMKSDTLKSSTEYTYDNLRTAKEENFSNSPSTEKSATTETTNVETKTTTEHSINFNNVTQKTENTYPEFTTGIYYLHDSQTSTEKSSTTTDDKKESIHQNQEIKANEPSTEMPSTSQFTPVSSSTTESLVLKEGEVIILPSGKIVTELKQLEEERKPKTTDSSKIQGTEYKVDIDSSTQKDSQAFNMTKDTEKLFDTHSTTEYSMHQTVQSKTSEIPSDSTKVERTTEKSAPETSTSINVDSESKENLSLNNLNKSTLFESKDSTIVTEFPVTTKHLDEKKENTEKIINIDSEKSITIKNSVKTLEDETTSETLSSESSTGATIKPITPATNAEELRESKIFNETNEATTLQWTTESNNNWTFESTNQTKTTLSTERVTGSSETSTSSFVSIAETTSIPVTEEGVRKIQLRPSLTNETETDTNNLIHLTQELLSSEGVKSTLKIAVKPVTESSESDESLEVDDVTKPEQEIKICASDICRKEGDENSKENEY